MNIKYRNNTFIEAINPCLVLDRKWWKITLMRAMRIKMSPEVETMK